MCVALMSIFDTLYMDKNRDNYTLLKLQHFRITEIAPQAYQTGVPATRRPQTPQGWLPRSRHDPLVKDVKDGVDEASLEAVLGKGEGRRTVHDSEPHHGGCSIDIVVVKQQDHVLLDSSCLAEREPGRLDAPRQLPLLELTATLNLALFAQGTLCHKALDLYYQCERRAMREEPQAIAGNVLLVKISQADPRVLLNDVDCPHSNTCHGVHLFLGMCTRICVVISLYAY